MTMLINYRQTKGHYMFKRQLRSISLILLSLANVSLLTCGIFVPTHVFADDNTSVVDEINITVPVSCTMSGAGMDTHNAEINNGQYDSAIGETVLKAFCNDTNGFAIYAIGYTGNEDGRNVLTNTSLGSTYDIITGTATSGNTSNWAMKLSLVASPTPTYPIIIAGSNDDADKAPSDLDYSSFQAVPNDYIKVAYRKAATDVNPTGQDNAEGSTLKTTYQAYISKTQPAGTYIGQVKYTMVHPYDATAPEKPLGQCQSSDTCMQQQTFTSLAQKLPNVGDITTLYDARDNQAYKVAKLADGKYWMTENLNIAGGTALSSDDTDFDSNYILPTTNGWAVTDEKLILPPSAIKNDADNNLTDNSQFNTDNYAYVFNSGNKENCGDSGQNTPCYSYYSWDTATLGSGRNITTENTDADYSICPKNWRLPTSGGMSNEGWKRGDFYTLASAYGANLENNSFVNSSTFFESAGYGTTPDFLLVGGYMSGSFNSGGNYGFYWSSTSGPGSQYARFLQFTSYSVDSGHGLNRWLGQSIRCLFGS